MSKYTTTNEHYAKGYSDATQYLGEFPPLPTKLHKGKGQPPITDRDKYYMGYHSGVRVNQIIADDYKRFDLRNLSERTTY